MASCVNISSKEFKDLSTKYKIDKEYLEDFLNEYNKDSKEEFKYPSNKEVEEYFGLNNAQSSTIYQTLEEFEIVSNNWKKFKEMGFPSLKVANLNKLSLSKYFNPNDIKVYKNSDGKFSLNILKPTRTANFVFNIPQEQVESPVKESKEFTLNPVPEAFLKEAKRREDFNKSQVLKDSDKKYLAQQISNIFSKMLDEMQGPNSEAAIQKYFGNIDLKLDPTTVNRKDLISVLDPVKVFSYIKETYLDPYNREGLSDEILEELDEAYTNFDLVLELSATLLKDNEGISISESKSLLDSENVISENEDETFATFNPEESLREGWQTEFRSEAPSKSLSTLLKRTFGLLEFKDSEGNLIVDKYGFPKTVDSNEVYNILLHNLSNHTDINAMEAALDAMRSKYEWVSQLKEAINNEPLRSQFFSAMRKHNTNYTAVTRSIDGKKSYTYRHQNLNTKDALTSFIDSIEELFTTEKINIVKSSNEGQVILNQNLVGKLIERINTLQNNQLLFKDANGNISLNKLEESNDILKRIKSMKTKEGSSVFTAILEEIGIFIPDDVVKSVVEVIPDNITKASHTQASQLLDLIRDLLEKGFATQGDTESNPVKDNQSRYKKIIKPFEDSLVDYIEASVFENGKMYYAYTNPGYLTILITKFKTLSDAEFMSFINQEYGQSAWFSNKIGFYNPWLRKLTEGTKEDRKRMRDLLNHEVLIHINKIDYSNQTEVEYTLSLMTEFFSGGNSDFARYYVPILADKPSSEFIRFHRYTGESAKGDMITEISRMAEQELARIKTVMQRAEDPNILAIDHFDLKENDTLGDAGAKFHFLPSLNKYITRDPSTGEFMDPRFMTAVYDYIYKDELTDFNYILDIAKEDTALYMEELFNNSMQNWEEMGVLHNEGKTHLSKLLANGNLRDQLENYFYNSFIASSSIIQLTVSDLAFYKNVEDFQKRFAQIHAPASKGNIYALDKDGKRYTDGMERSIYIKDDVIVSEIKDKVRNILEKHTETLNNPEEINNYKRNVEEVLKNYDEANFLDGQGYTTISGIRKKYGIFGRWTPEMDIAFDRIKKGNFDLSDVDALWQPLKPFMFSNVHINSGVGTIQTLKVPTMHKNSEYVLFLTAAIISGEKNGNTKLAALHDFMEENNIDLIQSVSAVKTGAQGTIDISGDMSYNKVREVLNRQALMPHKDENGKRIHNPQRVHQIPFEDYGIQQEVPEHLVDHHTLFGTQFRKLITSDIPIDAEFNIAGVKMEAPEMLNAFQNLIANNIKDTFNDLMTELDLNNPNASEFTKNKAISDLLSAEIKNSSKYSSDLLRAVALNSKGDFTIPLSDPIHSVQIQQLFGSIIKSRISKQKIKGGSAVQVSSFGLASDLKIKFSEDGSHIEYMEAAIPPPSNELREALTVYIKDKNGNIINSYIDINKRSSDGKLIYPINLREIVGYRIPTEGKYSMVPIRVTRFLPTNAGSGIMLPREVTTLTGSDFDIDKMYLMLPEFKAQSYDLNAAKKVYEKIKGILSDVVNTENEISVEDLTGTKFGEWFNSLTTEQKVDFKLTDTRFQKIEYKTQEDKTKEYAENNTKARNNRILDITKAILTHPSIQDQYFNPGSFSIPKKTARIINIAKTKTINPNTNKPFTYQELNILPLATLQNIEKDINTGNEMSILDPTTQVYFHEQNMLAKKIIGIAANHNSSHAMVQQLGDVRFQDFNPIHFNNIQYTGVISNVIAHNNTTYISRILAEVLAASVDAVKDPVLKYLNFNTNTIGPAMVLLRMGHSMDSVGLFMTLPVIEDLCKTISIVNSTEFSTPNEILSRVISGMGETMGITKENIENILKTRTLSIKANRFTTETMFQNINSGERSKDFDLDALLTFQNLLSHANSLREITSITKLDTQNAVVGPSIADTLVSRIKVKKFFSRNNSEGKPAPFSKDAYSIFEKLPMLGAFYKYNTQAFDNIFSPHFPQLTSDYENIITYFNEELDLNLNVKDINLILSDLTTFKYTKLDIFNGSEESRRGFLYNFPEKVRDFKSEHPELSDNKLIKGLVLKSSGKKNKAPFTVVNVSSNGGMSSTFRNQIQMDWDKLLENESTKKFALDIIKYSFYRAGWEFSPMTPMHLTTFLGRESLPDFIEYSRKNSTEASLFTSLTNVGSSTNIFLNQFLRNHSESTKFVKKVDYSNIEPYIVEGSGSQMVLADNKYLNTDNLVEGQIVKVVDDKVEYLYMYTNNKFVPTSKLGVRFSSKEYDFFDGSIESVIEENKKLFITKESTYKVSTGIVYKGDSHNTKLEQIDNIVSAVFKTEKSLDSNIESKVAELLGKTKEEMSEPLTDDTQEVVC